MGKVGRRGNWLATREHGLLHDVYESKPRVLAGRWAAAWPAVEYAAAGYPAVGDDAVAREPGVRAARQPVARRRPARRLRSEQFALRWVAGRRGWSGIWSLRCIRGWRLRPGIRPLRWPGSRERISRPGPWFSALQWRARRIRGIPALAGSRRFILKTQRALELPLATGSESRISTCCSGWSTEKRSTISPSPRRISAPAATSARRTLSSPCCSAEPPPRKMPASPPPTPASERPGPVQHVCRSTGAPADCSSADLTLPPIPRSDRGRSHAAGVERSQRAVGKRVRALLSRDLSRSLEAPGGGDAVVAGGQDQLAVLAVKLRRVEALAAPLCRVQGLADGLEGAAGLTGPGECGGQQAQEVRPEVLRAK